MVFFFEIEKLILKYIQNLKETRVAETGLKKNKSGVFKQIFKQEQKSAHREGNSAFLNRSVI